MQCNNATPEVDDLDTIQSSKQKLIVTSRKLPYPVGWRRAMLLALFFTIIASFFAPRGKNSGKKFFICAALLFVLFYIALDLPSKQHWEARANTIEMTLIK
jgi:hypothetical protein